MTFTLIPAFHQKTVLAELPLSKVLFNSTKDFPWVLLIPRVNDIVQINHLSLDDQLQLTREINAVSGIMETTYPTDRLNVAAIGNMAPQLHVHVICRQKSDRHWPDVVWNKETDALTDSEAQEQIELLTHKFKEIQL